jgi:uncharacterized protein YggE
LLAVGVVLCGTARVVDTSALSEAVEAAEAEARLMAAMQTKSVHVAAILAEQPEPEPEPEPESESASQTDSPLVRCPAFSRLAEYRHY